MCCLGRLHWLYMTSAIVVSTPTTSWLRSVAIQMIFHCTEFGDPSTRRSIVPPRFMDGPLKNGGTSFSETAPSKDFMSPHSLVLADHRYVCKVGIRLK
ncbi:hypothetical protein BDV97DRAFT_91844 [Delphinella strobiligena]|nr:hypothetical protein BDV97DRAFT_91844 [Delphinella strobiligena]